MAEVDSDYHAVKAASEAAIAALNQGAKVFLWFKGSEESVSVTGLKFERFIVTVQAAGNRTFFVPHSAVAAFSVS